MNYNQDPQSFRREMAEAMGMDMYDARVDWAIRKSMEINKSAQEFISRDTYNNISYGKWGGSSYTKDMLSEDIRTMRALADVEDFPATGMIADPVNPNRSINIIQKSNSVEIS